MRHIAWIASGIVLFALRCGSDDSIGGDAATDATTDSTVDASTPNVDAAPDSGDAGGPPWLAVDMPSQTTLKGSTHKVFAHYFPPFPISIDNKDASVDYYATQYLTPGGESNKHIAYGGFFASARCRVTSILPLIGSSTT